MDESTRKSYDAARTFSGKTFRSGCYAPFVSLYFNTLGDVLVCCKNETFVLGNVARQRLDEIWNGGKIRRLRQALVNYDFEQGCQVCEWQMTGGNHQGSLAWLFEEFPIDSAEPEWPAMIEFAVSNTCNFECIMCYGELSSLIRTHRDGLPPLPRFYSDEFFHDLRKYLPNLQRAKFLGGEPFLAQESLQIWNMMIEDGLSIPCHVTTNGSQYNSKVERVLEALPVSVSVSIDGVTKETVETIRLNCQYDTLIKNVYRFREYTRRRGTYMSLTYCLMRQNWHEFGEFLLFAEELGCEVFVNTVIDPPHCSLYKLPPASLAHIADEMEKRDSGIEHDLHLNRPLWKETLLKLRNSATEHQAERLTRVLQSFHRGMPEKVCESKPAAAKE
jgi:radical SAM protein with 4Fe4S-binding SPASM domain